MHREDPGMKGLVLLATVVFLRSVRLSVFKKEDSVRAASRPHGLESVGLIVYLMLAITGIRLVSMTLAYHMALYRGDTIGPFCSFMEANSEHVSSRWDKNNMTELAKVAG
jgi:hypothetical protein